MQMHQLNNKTLVSFIEEPRPNWVLCRWISVNGLSWDVIKVLGNYKGLHRLAIEDLINTRNRTKADWYSDHTYSKFCKSPLVIVYRSNVTLDVNRAFGIANC